MAGELGIGRKVYSNPESFVIEKYTLEKPVKVLETRVNLFDENGTPGAKQVFSTDIQNSSTIKVMSPYE